jgi:hypothetical protein
MPCAAPPIRVYPAGTGAAELDATALAVELLDTAAADADDADDAAETVVLAVVAALPHDVTVTVTPMTTGSARPTTRIRNLPPFLGNRGKRSGASFKTPLNAPGITPGHTESRHITTATA